MKRTDINKLQVLMDSYGSDVNKEIKFTLQDILDAVKYGFDYRDISQHQGFVPRGNILQWLMRKKNLVDVPKNWVE